MTHSCMAARLTFNSCAEQQMLYNIYQDSRKVRSRVFVLCQLTSVPTVLKHVCTLASIDVGSITHSNHSTLLGYMLSPVIQTET